MLAFFALVAAGGFFGWLLNGLTVQWEPGLWPTLDLGFDLGFDAGLAQRVAGLLPFLEEKKDVEGGTSSRDYSGDGGGVFVVYGPGQAPDSESEGDNQGLAEFCFRGEVQRKIELGGEIHPQRVVARMENPPRSFRSRSSSGGASLKMEKEWEKAKREEMEGGCATVEEDVIVVDGSERMSFGSPSRGEDGNKRIWGSYLTLSGSYRKLFAYWVLGGVVMIIVWEWIKVRDKCRRKDLVEQARRRARQRDMECKKLMLARGARANSITTAAIRARVPDASPVITDGPRVFRGAQAGAIPPMLRAKTWHVDSLQSHWRSGVGAHVNAPMVALDATPPPSASAFSGRSAVAATTNIVTVVHGAARTPLRRPVRPSHGLECLVSPPRAPNFSLDGVSQAVAGSVATTNWSVSQSSVSFNLPTTASAPAPAPALVQRTPVPPPITFAACLEMDRIQAAPRDRNGIKFDHPLDHSTDFQFFAPTSFGRTPTRGVDESDEQAEDLASERVTEGRLHEGKGEKRKKKEIKKAEKEGMALGREIVQREREAEEGSLEKPALTEEELKRNTGKTLQEPWGKDIHNWPWQASTPVRTPRNIFRTPVNRDPITRELYSPAQRLDLDYEADSIVVPRWLGSLGTSTQQVAVTAVSNLSAVVSEVPRRLPTIVKAIRIEPLSAWNSTFGDTEIKPPNNEVGDHHQLTLVPNRVRWALGPSPRSVPPIVLITSESVPSGLTLTSPERDQIEVRSTGETNTSSTPPGTPSGFHKLIWAPRDEGDAPPSPMTSPEGLPRSAEAEARKFGGLDAYAWVHMDGIEEIAQRDGDEDRGKDVEYGSTTPEPVFCRPPGIGGGSPTSFSRAVVSIPSLDSTRRPEITRFPSAVPNASPAQSPAPVATLSTALARLPSLTGSPSFSSLKFKVESKVKSFSVRLSSPSPPPSVTPRVYQSLFGGGANSNSESNSNTITTTSTTINTKSSPKLKPIVENVKERIKAKLDNVRQQQHGDFLGIGGSSFSTSS